MRGRFNNSDGTSAILQHLVHWKSSRRSQCRATSPTETHPESNTTSCAKPERPAHSSGGPACTRLLSSINRSCARPPIAAKDLSDRVQRTPGAAVKVMLTAVDSRGHKGSKMASSSTSLEQLPCIWETVMNKQEQGGSRKMSDPGTRQETWSLLSRWSQYCWQSKPLRCAPKANPETPAIVTATCNTNATVTRQPFRTGGAGPADKVARNAARASRVASVTTIQLATIAAGSDGTST
mmetsp:Transcript_39992/g.89808  ORF Transcript_39992/g.89808 Transcript_39992/m.89808 type:complete len:237 (-) Transcript_39992:81-791(-)